MSTQDQAESSNDQMLQKIKNMENENEKCAVKYGSNAMYGYFNSPQTKKEPSAISITEHVAAFSRQTNKQYKVVYGDTDSAFVVEINE